MQDDKVFKLLRIVPAGAYNGAIWFVSSLAMPAGVNNYDKSAHLLEYSILGFFLAFAFETEDNFNIVVKYSLLLGILLGALDEFHQFFVPTRSMNIFDFFTDFIGILAGIFIWLLFFKMLRYLKLNLFSRKT
jgi:VanZ family protein